MPLPPTELETPCREWQGYRNRDGYGVLDRAGRKHPVHRWVWSLMHGPIPEGIKVLRHCDNPACFRLDHLFLGTQLDNVQDRDAKGRCRSGAGQKARTHCPKGHSYDEANTFVDKHGKRHCKKCTNDRLRERNDKARPGGPEVCPACGSGFPTAKSLGCHLARRHPGEYPRGWRGEYDQARKDVRIQTTKGGTP